MRAKRMEEKRRAYDALLALHELREAPRYRCRDKGALRHGPSLAAEVCRTTSTSMGVGQDLRRPDDAKNL